MRGHFDLLHLENRIGNSRASGLRIPLGSLGAGQIELPIYYKRGETHEMNKSPNDRGSREAEVLCLCPICAADFYLSGKYTIRKADEMQVVSNVTVRSMAPRADANVLNAFENLEFKIEINPTSSYSGYFSVKAHNIILKKSSGDTIYHELGHFVGWLAGNVDTSSEFVAIYNKEKSALQSANYQYLTKSSAEYFAESYKDYVLSPQNLQSSRPQTYEFVKNAVSRITDARVTNIKSAYMKAYWT